MAKVITLKLGDPCPSCDGEFRAARVPTAEQRKMADDRENRVPLPAHYDTANEATRADLGDLYRCESCGYTTRFKPEGADDSSAGEGEGEDGQADAPAPRRRAPRGAAARS